MRKVLLTGGTGVVGSALISKILEDERTELHLIIRATSVSQLQQRHENIVTFLELPAHQRSKVFSYQGDTTKDNLGLAIDAYRKISSGLTHIVHAAGMVRMNLPLHEARKSAVNAMHHILSMARDAKLAHTLEKVEIVSTVGVGGKWQGILPERFLNENRCFHNTYEEAKAEAELLIEAAIATGLPMTVHRPSMVVGDSTTGRSIHPQVFHFLCNFLSGRLTLGIVPESTELTIDIVPVDFVAAAICASMASVQAVGKVLHLCSSAAHAVPLNRLSILVHDLLTRKTADLPKRIPVSVDKFLELLPTIQAFCRPGTGRALKTLPVYLEYMKTASSFQNVETLQFLNGLGVTIPESKNYLERICEAAL